MKEFENWWERNEDDFNAIHCAARDSWEAALKWVLEEITLSPIGLKTIEEELGLIELGVIE